MEIMANALLDVDTKSKNSSVAALLSRKIKRTGFTACILRAARTAFSEIFRKVSLVGVTPLMMGFCFWSWILPGILPCGLQTGRL